MNLAVLRSYYLTQALPLHTFNENRQNLGNFSQVSLIFCAYLPSASYVKMVVLGNGRGAAIGRRPIHC